MDPFRFLNLGPKMDPKRDPRRDPERDPKMDPKIDPKGDPQNRQSVVITTFSVIWDPLFEDFRAPPRGQTGSPPRARFELLFEGPKIAESIVYIRFGNLFGP